MDLNARGPEEGQLMIAPLIDIVFVVLIFFVATYAMAREEKHHDVVLPETAKGEVRRAQRQRILINLDRQGAIFVQGQRYSEKVLLRRLSQLVDFAIDEANQPTVVIRADGDCPHRHVMTAMDICKQAGVRRISWSALPKEGDS